MITIDKKSVESLIHLALAEDIGAGDITSEAMFSRSELTSSKIISKDTGIFCGGDILRYVYEAVDPLISVKVKTADGGKTGYGDVVAELEGPVISLLKGERTALNFIQRMCAIATKTGTFVKLLEGSGIKILDTRKTLPGFRLLDKYAVSCGGGENHRIGLFDMVLIKDNHIKAAGSIAAAVKKIRNNYDSRFRIEVEASTIDEVIEAAAATVDIIMLDNMNRSMMEESVKIISGKCKIEVSGNMDEEKIKSLRDLKIDYISAGGLTHSVNAFDLSMKF